MRILVLGDTHANVGWFAHVFQVAKESKCDLIYQVGDFGYMPHTKEGIDFLSFVSYSADTEGLPVYFHDGNHENFTELWDTSVGEVTPQGFRQMLPSLYYVPRGTVWTWGDKRFAAMGGAYSLDKLSRLAQEKTANQPRTRWWPEETIKFEDIETLTKNLDHQSVDLFFSHDKPEKAIVTNNWRPFFTGYSFASDLNQQYLQTAVDLAKPRILIHGHFHHNYITELFRPAYHTKVFGLHCDGAGPRSWVILDIHEETNSVEVINSWESD